MTIIYPWGSERPRVRRIAVADERRAIPLQQLKLVADFCEAMRRLDLRARELDAEIEMIDFVAPNGRFIRERVSEWSERGGSVAGEGAPKRQRGRPRKYGPNDPRPTRKSRAKTKAGLARAALRSVQTPIMKPSI